MVLVPVSRPSEKTNEHFPGVLSSKVAAGGPPARFERAVGGGFEQFSELEGH